ncbi:MAG: hypothetical protein JW841_18725, partial [Deltaproteobacteria bacterium]|nr:hypothetical protein [Deltaproteobacteria bacterium]
MEELLRTHDNNAEKCMSKIYKNRNFKWDKKEPFLNLNTTLSMLLLPLVFIKSLGEENFKKSKFKINLEEYDLTLSNFKNA